MTNKSNINTKLRAFCAKCKGERNCDIKGHHRESGSEDEHYDWWRDWYLLVCCGCDHVFTESRFSDSESADPVGYDADGDVIYEHEITIKSWPARFRRDRPDWLDRLNALVEHERSQDLETCLYQVYEALDHDLNILAAIGIRTTFDVACEILGVDSELPFNAKLKSMEQSAIVTPSQRDDFEVLINAGSASAHRGWNPTFHDLDPLVGSLEQFLLDKFVTPTLRKIAAAGVARVKAKVPIKMPKAEKAAKPRGAIST